MDGFRNEALRAALRSALGGNRTALDELMIRHGAQPGPAPNLKLAAAFGEEIAALPQTALRLLRDFADDPSPIESPRVFLPVAATYGWVATLRSGRDVEVAWSALRELAADPRRPVRTSVIAALRELSMNEPAADVMVARATEWLEVEEAGIRFSASALALEVLSDSHVLAAIRDHERFLAYLSRGIDVVADATRAAERLEGRRRMLTSLSNIAAVVAKQLRAADRGVDWLAAECERATHPDIRAALSQALLILGKSNVARGMVDRLRKVLETSAKPVRDAARVRPGTGRGRKTRSIR